MSEISYIKWKNILSWGNNYNEIDFNNLGDKLLINGNQEQGVGKSSIIDIISFAIFGKIIRENNIKEIINMYNKYNLNTFIEIKNNDNIYNINRVIKKKSDKIHTEIFENGKQIDNLDKQLELLYIEKNITGYTFNQFKDDIIISLPEFKLNNLESFFKKLFNLEYLDDLEKNYIKEQKQLNKKIKINSNNINNKSNEINNLKNILNNLNENNEKEILELENKIKNLELNKKNKKKKYNKIIRKMKELKSFKLSYNNDIKELKNNDLSLGYDIKSINKDIKYLNDNNYCSYCKHNIDDKHKEIEINNLKEKLNTINKEKDELKETIENKKLKYKKIKEKIDKLNKYKIKIKEEISSFNGEIKSIKNDIDKRNNKEDDNNIDKKIDNLKSETESLQSEIDNLNDRKKTVDLVLSEIFCDNGYKYNIMMSYINKLNESFEYYLQKFIMDNTQIVILNDFSIKIIRYGKVMGFNYLSNGEKAIIRSIFFIHVLKESNDYGFKIYDELKDIDSSLSNENFNIFIDIINEIFDKDKHIFISHRTDDFSKNKFDNIIKISKDDMFSELQIK